MAGEGGCRVGFGAATTAGGLPAGGAAAGLRMGGPSRGDGASLTFGEDGALVAGTGGFAPGRPAGSGTWAPGDGELAAGIGAFLCRLWLSEKGRRSLPLMIAGRRAKPGAEAGGVTRATAGRACTAAGGLKSVVRPDPSRALLDGVPAGASGATLALATMP